MNYRSSWVDEDIAAFRPHLRRFLTQELAPRAAAWRKQKAVDRDAWTALGRFGALLASVPPQYGGLGKSFAYEAAIIEDIEKLVPELTAGISAHNAIVSHYLLKYGSEAQRLRWLPRMASGELIGAIAMTEPQAGSDLQALSMRARRSGGNYVISGQKTFVTNGRMANLLVVAAKTDSSKGAKGISLFVVETDACAGFKRGPVLDKIGLHAAGTCEMFFEDVVLAAENLLGDQEGLGFQQMMEQLPQERLTLAIGAVAAMERAIEITTAYTKERKAFGKAILDFQAPSFTMAEVNTTAVIARIFVDWCIERLTAGALDTTTACMAKWWTTDKQVETIDACLQLHGGYGYMEEYPIARMYVDARAQKIYGGTNEIMKLLIARSLKDNDNENI